MQELTNKLIQLSEYALREKFYGTLIKKEDEIKKKDAKIELKKSLTKNLKVENAKTESYGKEAIVFQEENSHLKQKIKLLMSSPRHYKSIS